MIPSDLASFVACHEARDCVGAIGDPIDQLLSKYGGLVGQVQGDASKKPVISEIFGWRALYFDNSDDSLLMNAASSLTEPYTVFTVYSPRGLGSAGRRMLAGEDTGTHNWLMGPYSGRYRTFTGGWMDGPSLAHLPVYVHCLAADTPGNYATYYLNNVALGSQGMTTRPGVIAHGVHPSGYSEPADCDWIATITFNALLAGSDRTGIYDYIRTDVLAGGFNLFSQANIEAVMTGQSDMRFSQTCIEYVRSVENAGQRFWGQIIQ